MDPYKYNLLGEGFSRFRISELKDILRSNNLKVSGTRQTLISRLEDNNVESPERSADHSRSSKCKITKRDFVLSTPPKETYTRWKCNIDFYPALLNRITAKGLYNHILDHFELPAMLRRRHNKTYGDDGMVYRIKFGGYGTRPERIVHREALKWDTIPMLPYLRKLVEHVTGATFTYCVIQYYPMGRVGIKRHRDKEMLPGTMIAGVSLGQVRTLQMESIHDSLSMYLYSGSLYVLKPPTNDYWMHCIPEDDTTSPRLSLTFRNLPSLREGRS